MSAPRPVRFGVVGLGGYAVTAAGMLDRSAQNDGTVEWVAACEPDLVTHAARADELRARGIKVTADLDVLLAEPIDAVWLPLPIDLHRPFTIKALAAGRAVLCEKPAAGCIDDIDAMIAARDQSGLAVAIGYQDMYDPLTIAIKRRILAGEIGDVSKVSLHACWPRPDTYYNRNKWAGKFRRGDTWVMDGPANNALSHYINLTLFLLGPTLFESARPAKVEAELYHVNPIETDDTFCCRVTTETGSTALVLFTHACSRLIHPIIDMVGTKGTLRRTQDGTAAFTVGGGQTLLKREVDLGRSMVKRFCQLTRGEQNPDVGVATLENSRQPVAVVNAAHEATAVQAVADSYIKKVQTEGGVLTTIDGIESLFERCCQRHVLPSESGEAPWSQAPSSRDTRNYTHFAGPASLVAR